MNTKVDIMPEYLIEVKNTKHGRKRKEKIFAPSSSEAEEQVKLEKTEYVLSVANNNFSLEEMKIRKRT